MRRCLDAYSLKALTRAPKVADIVAENQASSDAGTQLKRSLGIVDLLGFGGMLVDRDDRQKMQSMVTLKIDCNHLFFCTVSANADNDHHSHLLFFVCS
jgi:hypothetical protein